MSSHGGPEMAPKPPNALRSFHCSARRLSAAHLALPRAAAKPWRSSNALTGSCSSERRVELSEDGAGLADDGLDDVGGAGEGAAEADIPSRPQGDVRASPL